MQRQIHIVTDIQYGSTGKGALIGYLAKRLLPDTLVTAWAPSAGHTFIDSSGRKFIHVQLANGVVSSSVKRILVGPGSAINPDILQSECEAVGDLTQNITLMIHPHAAIVDQYHRESEKIFNRIGSTQKGGAEAVIQKMRRDPDNMGVAKTSEHPFIKEYVVTVEEYNQALDESKIVLVEGAQGFGLSIHHGFLPYTTYRDVTPHQVLADCGIPFNFGKITSYGTCRTYPIRVANRYDISGNQVGFSGPCYPDQIEIQWSDLGMEAELTTVTKLPRRIFTFSKTQYKEAVRMCGIDIVFLNFANYLATQQDACEFAKNLNLLSPAQVKYIGIGPTEDDIREVSMVSFPEIYKLNGFKTSIGGNIK
jgi:adenylosuccinate synthase